MCQYALYLLENSLKKAFKVVFMSIMSSLIEVLQAQTTQSSTVD